MKSSFPKTNFGGSLRTANPWGPAIADEAFATWLSEQVKAPKGDEMRRLSPMPCGYESGKQTHDPVR